jgi:L,D-peptidoglycan transpeptidase YkuD (ErfK/YbiS/YcfS/YnhG family)
VIVNGKRVKQKVFRTEYRKKSSTGASSFKVAARPGSRTKGILMMSGQPIPVALGRGGIRHDKREGDGATPAGVWHPVEVRWRADHGGRPITALPVRATQRRDGWCDEPASPRYNRPVQLPFRGSHEEMWRQDHLYDLVVVLDHNRRPRKTRRGSAVFLHLAREGFEPTAGCIAFRRADLYRLLARLSPRSKLRVG